MDIVLKFIQIIMKIGILTYHRSHNYGALLQATALRYVLQKKNHEVFYVDYCTEYHKRMYKIFSWSSFFKLSFWGKLKYLFNFFRYFLPIVHA